MYQKYVLGIVGFVELFLFVHEFLERCIALAHQPLEAAVVLAAQPSMDQVHGMPL